MRSLTAASSVARASSKPPVSRYRTREAAVGNTSLEDWHILTWVLGWTRSAPLCPVSSSLARFPSTSLTFMLMDVPQPRNTLTGN